MVKNLFALNCNLKLNEASLGILHFGNKNQLGCYTDHLLGIFCSQRKRTSLFSSGSRHQARFLSKLIQKSFKNDKLPFLLRLPFYGGLIEWKLYKVKSQL